MTARSAVAFVVLLLVPGAGCAGEQAVQSLESAGLTADSFRGPGEAAMAEPGSVIEQQPAPGTGVSPSTVVSLTVAP